MHTPASSLITFCFLITFLTGVLTVIAADTDILSEGCRLTLVVAAGMGNETSKTRWAEIGLK